MVDLQQDRWQRDDTTMAMERCGEVQSNLVLLGHHSSVGLLAHCLLVERLLACGQRSRFGQRAQQHSNKIRLQLGRSRLREH